MLRTTLCTTRNTGSRSVPAVPEFTDGDINLATDFYINSSVSARAHGVG